MNACIHDMWVNMYLVLCDVHGWAYSQLNQGFFFLMVKFAFLLQSGFEGFIRDKYTILPETRERMLATEVSASWMYDFSILYIKSKMLTY